jgi:hypothetical protein
MATMCRSPLGVASWLPVLMIFGIGIFAVLTSFVAASFVRLYSDPEEIIAIVKEENATIRAELAELKELIKENKTKDETG